MKPLQKLAGLHENVASDRDAVTKVFTSPEVMAIIRSRKIILISHKEAKL